MERLKKGFACECGALTSAVCACLVFVLWFFFWSALLVFGASHESWAMLWRGLVPIGAIILFSLLAAWVEGGK